MPMMRLKHLLKYAYKENNNGFDKGAEGDTR